MTTRYQDTMTQKINERLDRQITAMRLYVAVRRGLGAYTMLDGRSLPVKPWKDLPESHKELLRNRAAAFESMPDRALPERLYAAWHSDRNVPLYGASKPWVWELWALVAKAYTALESSDVDVWAA
jgi:hypothetical protein